MQFESTATVEESKLKKYPATDFEREPFSFNLLMVKNFESSFTSLVASFS